MKSGDRTYCGGVSTLGKQAKVSAVRSFYPHANATVQVEIRRRVMSTPFLNLVKESDYALFISSFTICGRQSLIETRGGVAPSLSVRVFCFPSCMTQSGDPNIGTFHPNKSRTTQKYVRNSTGNYLGFRSGFACLDVSIKIEVEALIEQYRQTIGHHH